MSWSVGVSGKERDELFTALDDGFENNYSEPGTGVVDQFEAAKECVDGLLAVLNGEQFNCSLSGHSQADMPDSAPDSISISLYAVAQPTE